MKTPKIPSRLNIKRKHNTGKTFLEKDKQESPSDRFVSFKANL